MIATAFFMALFVALISSIYLAFEDSRFNLVKTLKVFVVSTIISTIVITVIFYLAPPAIVGIWNGWFRVIFIYFVIISVILLIYSMLEEDAIGAIIQGIKICVMLLAFGYLLATPIMFDNELHDLPKIVVLQNLSEANGIFDPIDLKHIRLVDRDLAYSLGSNIIGSRDNFGSIYRVEKDDFHIQTVNNHLWWVAPLEFQGYGKWRLEMTSPGFIMVDAEDPFATPQMYTDYEMKYLPSSYWGNYLYRYVYAQGYSHYKLEDITFEVTDELLPRWTISATRPTINNDGSVVKLLLVVDPEGYRDIEEYLPKDAPEWVDRVIPERIAANYMTYYGTFVHGWWNYNGIYVSQKDVNVPTGGLATELFFVHGADQRPFWFGGMTSPSNQDHSLTSIILTDARTGILYKFPMSGANEQAALDAINSKYSEKPNWYGTAPIPYNVNGILTYIVPITAHEGSGNIYQGVGFVDAMTKHAVIGETKEDTIAEYQKYLSTKGINLAISTSNSIETIGGIVSRIGDFITDGKSNSRIIVDSSDIIFTVDPGLWPEASITQIKDVVNISYTETGDTIVVATSFDNLNVTTRVSPEQEELDKIIAKSDEKIKTNWDVQKEASDTLDQLRGGN